MISFAGQLPIVECMQKDINFYLRLAALPSQRLFMLLCSLSLITLCLLLLFLFLSLTTFSSLAYLGRILSIFFFSFLNDSIFFFAASDASSSLISPNGVFFFIFLRNSRPLFLFVRLFYKHLTVDNCAIKLPMSGCEPGSSGTGSGLSVDCATTTT